MNMEQFITHLEQDMEIVDWDAADGVLVEHSDPSSGFCQLIGPFPKNTVDALSFIERLRSEEDPDATTPCEYRIRLLFPPQ